MNIAKLNLIGRAATAAICMVTAFSAMAWSQKGHDVTAAIAERHLTPEAAEAIDSLLDGRSIVYWANWLDNASHTPEYAYSRTWHYRNVDANETYATARVAPDGDVVSAIQLNMSTLRNPQAPKADKALALKMFVHLVGDLHQPLHMGHASDLGGNTIKVKFFGQEKNLHSVWDGSLLESAHRWSYTEWADQLDRLSEMQQKLLQSGTVDDWAARNVELAARVYKNTPAGANLSYDAVAYWAPVIEDQLIAGGLRLARLLNDAFTQAHAE